MKVVELEKWDGTSDYSHAHRVSVAVSDPDIPAWKWYPDFLNPAEDPSLRLVFTNDEGVGHYTRAYTDEYNEFWGEPLTAVADAIWEAIWREGHILVTV